jgi:hypothetical protein
MSYSSVLKNAMRKSLPARYFGSHEHLPQPSLTMACPRHYLNPSADPGIQVRAEVRANRAAATQAGAGWDQPPPPMSTEIPSAAITFQSGFAMSGSAYSYTCGWSVQKLANRSQRMILRHPLLER